MHAPQFTDPDAQGQGEDADPSAGRGLDSDLDRDLGQAWESNEPCTWSTVKDRGRVGVCETGCGPRARSSTPNLAPNDIQKGTMHETNNTMTEKPHATPARKGCHDAWLLFDRLRTEIEKIPREVLEDPGGNSLWYELSGCNSSAALAVCADVPRDELWENVNPGLDRILGFRRPQEEIMAMVRHGRAGLQGLCDYLEVLVEEGGVVGGLLEGKVTALIAAMEE